MKPTLATEWGLGGVWYYYYQFSKDLLIEVHNDITEGIQCYTHQGRKVVLQAIKDIDNLISTYEIEVYHPTNFEDINEVFY